MTQERMVKFAFCFNKCSVYKTVNTVRRTFMDWPSNSIFIFNCWFHHHMSVFLSCVRFVMMTSSNGNILRVTELLCGELSRWPANFLHKGQWRGALIFSLIFAWINSWSKQWRRRWFGTPSRSLFFYCSLINDEWEVWNKALKSFLLTEGNFWIWVTIVLSLKTALFVFLSWKSCYWQTYNIPNLQNRYYRLVQLHFSQLISNHIARILVGINKVNYGNVNFMLACIVHIRSLFSQQMNNTWGFID